jgi:uncharacterized protein with FMN-binding domain
VKRQTKSASKRVAGKLVALGSVAILSVYGVGYARTQSAANAIAAQESQPASAPAAAATAVPTPVATIDSLLAATAVPPRLTPTALPKVPTNGFGSASTAVTPTPQGGRPTPTVPESTPTAASTLPPTATVAPTAAPAKSWLKDGSYIGSGHSRHGGIEATVVIAKGKIVSANVTSCGTRYPCSRVAPLVQEVITSQAAPVDLVSGATDSSYAYVDAITQALAQAS